MSYGKHYEGFEFERIDEDPSAPIPTCPCCGGIASLYKLVPELKNGKREEKPVRWAVMCDGPDDILGAGLEAMIEDADDPDFELQADESLGFELEGDLACPLAFPDDGFVRARKIDALQVWRVFHQRVTYLRNRNNSAFIPTTS